MNDTQMTKYLNMCKVVREFPINTVVGWYDSEDILFGCVKSYSYNTSGEVILDVEEFTDSSRTKLVRCLHPKNEMINLFKV